MQEILPKDLVSTKFFPFHLLKDPIRQDWEVAEAL